MENPIGCWWIFWILSDIIWQWPVLRVQNIHCRMHTSQRTWIRMFGEWVLSMILFVCFYMCSNVLHLPQWQELKSSYNWVCQSECTACRCCISKCPCQTFVIFLGWDCATEMCSLFASSMFSLHWTPTFGDGQTWAPLELECHSCTKLCSPCAHISPDWHFRSAVLQDMDRSNCGHITKNQFFRVPLSDGLDFLSMPGVFSSY